MLYRQLGDFLVLRSNEDEDWNLGRCAKELIEGLDSTAVGQEEIDQHCGYIGPFSLSFAGQSVQTLGTASNPFDLEGPIV
jgi:hypothetical protein